MTSVKDIGTFLHELEQEHGLLDWQARGTYVWPILRLPLHYELTVRTGLFKKNFARPRRPNPLALLKAFALNPFFRPGHKKFALIVHTRKVNGIDIYSDRLMREL